MTASAPVEPDVAAFQALLESQDGVVSRAQLVEADFAGHDLERLLRRRELFVALPGVYVDHNGPRTWQQRAWIAVLACRPAALAGASAIRAAAGPGQRGFDEDAPIEVAVDVARTVKDKPGVRVRRMAGLQARVRWNASPPRVRYEEATLDVVADLTDEWAIIERCAAAVRSRCTTPERLVEAMTARLRFPRRVWLRGVLADLAAGTSSVLEQGYLERIERAHGLPTADRQHPDRVGGGRIYRDVRYAAYALDVELDGRLFHDTAEQRDRDLDRDLETATTGRRTVRLGWGQVFGRPCRTTGHVVGLLRLGGWGGQASVCGPGCWLACAETPSRP